MIYLRTLIAVITVFFTANAFASPGRIIFSPEHPTMSSKLELRYLPGENTRDAAQVTAFVYLWSKGKEPFLVEMPLRRSGDAWMSPEPIGLDTVVYVSCKIVTEHAEDTNEDSWWGTRIFDKNGKPVEQSILAEVQSIGLRKKNFTDASVRGEALRLLSEESSMYPASPVWAIRWQLLFGQMARDKAMEQVEREIDSLSAVTLSENDLLDCSAWYERIGEPAKAEALLDTLIRKYNNPSAAIRKEFKPLRELRDYELIRTAIANMIDTYPSAPETDGLKVSLVQIAIQQRKLEEAARLLEKHAIRNSDLYLMVARQLLEEEGPPPSAVTVSARAVEITKAAMKPSFMASKEWQQQRNKPVSDALALYGTALSRSKRHTEAEPILADAIRLAPEPDSETLKAYTETLTSLGRTKDALLQYEKMIIAGFMTDELVEQYRKAFTGGGGTETEFELRLSELNDKAFSAKFETLKREAVNQSINNFTLPLLTGNESVELEKLRGKVVVLDFWATWCGPCRQSFPHLQKVYDRFKSSEDVRIYAVNTYERISGDARLKAVEKFISDNKYTFPVLLDSDVASSNGVQNIPTQFVVDKNGVIQFVTVGFEGPQMGDELGAKIELLRSEAFYK